MAFVLGFGLIPLACFAADSETCLRHSDCGSAKVCDRGTCVVSTQNSSTGQTSDGASSTDGGTSESGSDEAAADPDADGGEAATDSALPSSSDVTTDSQRDAVGASDSMTGDGSSESG